MTDCICTYCQDHRPSISLEKWREILCLNPYYFWQLQQNSATTPDTVIPGNTGTGTACDPLIYWSCYCECGDTSRQDIWDSLVETDLQIKEYIGTWPKPNCVQEEHYLDSNVSPYGWKNRHKCDYTSKVQLGCTGVEQLGTCTLEFIERVDVEEANFTDESGNGLLDTVTLVIPTPATLVGVPVEEILLFHNQDTWISDSQWQSEIRPIQVRDLGTELEIKFSSWLIVDPQLYDTLECRWFDPDDIGIYANTLDLYRYYINEEQGVQVCHKEWCPCTEDEDCWETDFCPACILSQQHSLIEIDTEKFKCKCIEREKLCINYVAGACVPDATIAILATANLPGRNKKCCQENEKIAHYQADFVGVDNRGRIVTTLSDAERSNEFGTLRGHVQSIKRLKRYKKQYKKSIAII